MPLLVKQDSKKSNHVCCISLTRHEYINFMMQFMGLPPFSNSTIRILLKLCAKHKSRKNINLSKIQIILHLNDLCIYFFSIFVYLSYLMKYVFQTFWNNTHFILLNGLCQKRGKLCSICCRDICKIRLRIVCSYKTKEHEISCWIVVVTTLGNSVSSCQIFDLHFIMILTNID